ncbi:MAG: hypothetical protein LBI03_02980, partial [Clostridiales bacterium]|nr:hypothetical protein [Clostridiales bacterium]
MKAKLTMQMPEALEARDVEIKGVIFLEESEYQNLLTSGKVPERYIYRVNKYTKAITEPNSCMIVSYKALLVISESHEDGIAVCGKNEVFYASMFPAAKEWLDRRIKEIADGLYRPHRKPGKTEKFLLKEAVDTLGAQLVGAELMSKYGAWPMYSKFFDF